MTTPKPEPGFISYMGTRLTALINERNALDEAQVGKTTEPPQDHLDTLGCAIRAAEEGILSSQAQTLDEAAAQVQIVMGEFDVIRDPCSFMNGEAQQEKCERALVSVIRLLQRLGTNDAVNRLGGGYYCFDGIEPFPKLDSVKV